jgi:hypothetical protein
MRETDRDRDREREHYCIWVVLETFDCKNFVIHLSNPTNCLCMYMHVSFNYCFCMRETDRDRDRERALLYHEKTIIVVMQSH